MSPLYTAPPNRVSGLEFLNTQRKESHPEIEQSVISNQNRENSFCDTKYLESTREDWNIPVGKIAKK